jgi:hypothetical protein
MKAKYLILPVLILAQAAAADAVKLLPSPLEMPDRIGPLRYLGEPKSWPDKRLGFAYPFQAQGMKLDVYIYDGGITGIPDGAGSQTVCHEFEEAKSGVRQGGYRDLALKREQLARTGPTQDPPLMREAVYEAVMNDMPVVSYVWITAVSNHFIKLRFSASTGLRDELEDARHAILQTLGDVIRPHLAPVAAPAADAKDDQKQTSIVVNPGATDDMQVGFAYLLSLTAATTDHPELNPPCGGRLEPGYATELQAFQMAAKIVSEAGAKKSKLGAKLREISHAGFLEEFVWQFRHRDFWGESPPADLELGEFKRWSRKNLKRFSVPEFGYVDVKHPRDLPIEAQ